jgi:hypothetical protein
VITSFMKNVVEPKFWKEDGKWWGWNRRIWVALTLVGNFFFLKYSVFFLQNVKSAFSYWNSLYFLTFHKYFTNILLFAAWSTFVLHIHFVIVNFNNPFECQNFGSTTFFIQKIQWVSIWKRRFDILKTKYGKFEKTKFPTKVKGTHIFLFHPHHFRSHHFHFYVETKWRKRVNTLGFCTSKWIKMAKSL